MPRAGKALHGAPSPRAHATFTPLDASRFNCSRKHRVSATRIERLAPRPSACGDRAAVADEIRRAMMGERRRAKRLMVSSLKQTREV